MNVSAFSVELKVETPIWDYRLPVVTGRAEPQEGGDIARAWIEDPKIYPSIPMPQVEGGDAHWRLYRLPIVTGGADPQEGGGIARAWIEDPKVYPGISMTKWWRWLPEGTRWQTISIIVLDGIEACLRGQWWLQAAIC